MDWRWGQLTDIGNCRPTSACNIMLIIEWPTQHDSLCPAHVLSLLHHVACLSADWAVRPSHDLSCSAWLIIWPADQHACVLHGDSWDDRTDEIMQLCWRHVCYNYCCSYKLTSNILLTLCATRHLLAKRRINPKKIVCHQQCGSAAYWQSTLLPESLHKSVPSSSVLRAQETINTTKKWTVLYMIMLTI